MTRIDFYILQDVAVSALHRFACRLASQAVSGGHQVVMHTSDETAGQALDNMLWDYPDRRFLPHKLEGDSATAPLLVTWKEPENYDGVLFNLTNEVPEFFTRFQRVVEIVVEETRDAGRDRYRFYRHRGYPLYDHKMDEWESDREVS